jgi:DNA-binding transcriptional ArsR family regulator
MAEKVFQPLERFIIEDLETLRVLAEPLRTQIYEILLSEPGNVRQVAERLGLAPSRMYYHFNLLEKYGLLRIVETRMVSNIQEKLYRSVAYELEVAPGLLDFKTEQGKQSIEEVLVSTLDTTREDLSRSLHARAHNLEQGAEEHPRSIVVTRLLASLKDEQAEEFQRRLRALLQDFGNADQTDKPGDPHQPFALTVAYYPSYYYASSEE